MRHVNFCLPPRQHHAYKHVQKDNNYTDREVCKTRNSGTAHCNCLLYTSDAADE